MRTLVRCFSSGPFDTTAGVCEAVGVGEAAERAGVAAAALTTPLPALVWGGKALVPACDCGAVVTCVDRGGAEVDAAAVAAASSGKGTLGGDADGDATAGVCDGNDPAAVGFAAAPAPAVAADAAALLTLTTAMKRSICVEASRTTVGSILPCIFESFLAVLPQLVAFSRSISIWQVPSSFNDFAILSLASLVPFSACF